jgi:hypothetical protein
MDTSTADNRTSGSNGLTAAAAELLALFATINRAAGIAITRSNMMPHWMPTVTDVCLTAYCSPIAGPLHSPLQRLMLLPQLQRCALVCRTPSQSATVLHGAAPCSLPRWAAWPQQQQAANGECLQ